MVVSAVVNLGRESAVVGLPWRPLLVVAWLAVGSVDCSSSPHVDTTSGGGGQAASGEGGATISGGAATAPTTDEGGAGATTSEGGDGGVGPGAPNGGGDGGAGPVGAADRYLVFEGWDASAEHLELWGVPTRRAGLQEPELWSDGAFSQELPLSADKVWSPDGRFLVFDAAWTDYETQFRNRFFYLDFRGGAPSAPRPIPELPEGSPIYLGDWDATSRVLTFITDSIPYVVDFNGEQATTRRFETPEEPSSAPQPCNGGSAFLLAGTSSTWLLGASPGAEPLDLGTEPSWVSTDGRWVVTQRESQAGASVSLRPCALDGEAVMLGRQSSQAPFDISSDNRFVATTLLTETDDSEIVVLELETGEVVARHAGSATMVDFSRSSAALLINTKEDSHLVWSFADDDVEALPPATGTVNCGWVSDRVLCSVSDLDDEDSLTTLVLHHPFHAEEPVVLVTGVGDLRSSLDASESWLNVMMEDDQALLQVNTAEPQQQKLIDLSEFGAGSYWVLDADANGGVLVQRQVIDFELLWFSADFNGVLYGSPTPSVASIQP